MQQRGGDEGVDDDDDDEDVDTNGDEDGDEASGYKPIDNEDDEPVSN